MDGGARDLWRPETLRALIGALDRLRASSLAEEARLAAPLARVAPAHRESARNLAHYLALRRVDLRELQEALAHIGLSSLGRSEAHVLATLERVLAVLRRLCGEAWTPSTPPVGIRHGSARLARNAEALFGAPPPGRDVRVMVTLPDEAAHDAALVERLVGAGMDVARINGAHGEPADWLAMARHVRAAAAACGRTVRIAFDLAGPKLRTGPLPPGPAVLKLRPQRDRLGRVLAPARVALVPDAEPAVASALATTDVPQVRVDAEWWAALREGDAIDLVDARGADRHWTVAHRDGAVVLAESTHTTYLAPGVRLLHVGRRGGVHTTGLGPLPQLPGAITLDVGARLRVCSEAAAAAAHAAGTGALVVGCTLPEVFAQVRAGERVWFDDGRIGGVIERADGEGFDLLVTRTREGGALLRADKGINLPDSRLSLPALTAKDRSDLGVVLPFADIVALSFAQCANDVEALRAALAERGAADRAVVLKIETRRGFEHLPELLLAAMAQPAAGVMIARGDLAVECGWERLAEVQEEILWAAEAAHLPVIWATQVLEGLAKGGQPSRAEITDAAMGVRAECVMLNKGPHIVEAIAALDDILRRMQAHQTKKRTLLRALQAWSTAAPTDDGSPVGAAVVRRDESHPVRQAMASSSD
ncbi:MAG: pyruvate kinase [Burkholderiaceae bacterium]|nr:pyruvate kinase [Burkholderiaceae bacterium]